MNRHSTLAIPTSSFDDIIERLRFLHCSDTPYKSLIDDGTAICLQNLEALRAMANRRLGVLLTINSLENFHWIARAIFNAISSEHERLSAQIEQLLALLDNYTRIELCQDLTVQENAFVQIKQLNDLAMSTLGLEQQVVPALLEICQNESVHISANLPQTLH